MTSKTVKISTFCDTKVEVVHGKHFIVYSPIEGDINEPWKYAVGNLPDNLKIVNIKCEGDCEKVHFYEQNNLTFFYLTYYCASYHEITFELQPAEPQKYILPKEHPGVFQFEKSKDGTLFCTFKLESAIIENLGFFETYSSEFVLPDDDEAKYKIMINKISDGHYAVCIENPYNIKIDGVSGNLNETFSLNTDLTYVRTFSFTYITDEEKKELAAKESASTKSSSDPLPVFGEMANFLKNTVEKSFHELFEDISYNPSSKRFVKSNAKDAQKLSNDPLAAAVAEGLKISDGEDSFSVVSSASGIASSTSDVTSCTSKTPSLSLSQQLAIVQASKEEKQKLLLQLQNTLLKNEYTDVILKASNGVELKSYRFILAAHSPAFKSIFDFTEEGLPVEIECIKFTAGTIYRALSFLYGKDEPLDGDEINLLEFANEYSIDALKAKCCHLLESKVSTKNVCEYVKIAHDNKFVDLKQKCIKLIAENKNEIDRKDIATIPHEVLLETFYS